MIGVLFVLAVLGLLIAIDAVSRHRHRISKWLDAQLFVRVCGCANPRIIERRSSTHCYDCGYLWVDEMSAPLTRPD